MVIHRAASSACTCSAPGPWTAAVAACLPLASATSVARSAGVDRVMRSAIRDTAAGLRTAAAANCDMNRLISWRFEAAE